MVVASPFASDQSDVTMNCGNLTLLSHTVASFQASDVVFVDQELISYRYSSHLLFFFLFLLGRPLQKSLRLGSNPVGITDAICSSIKYASIDEVGFSI